MRSYSLLAILLLCVAIVIVDVFSFLWLQSIIQHLNSTALISTINSIFGFLPSD